MDVANRIAKRMIEDADYIDELEHDLSACQALNKKLIGELEECYESALRDLAECQEELAAEKKLSDKLGSILGERDRIVRGASGLGKVSILDCYEKVARLPIELAECQERVAAAEARERWEQRAVTMYRKHYKLLQEQGSHRFDLNPAVVALTATCSACLEFLGLDDDKDFENKYELETDDE